MVIKLSLCSLLKSHVHDVNDKRQGKFQNLIGALLVAGALRFMRPHMGSFRTKIALLQRDIVRRHDSIDAADTFRAITACAIVVADQLAFIAASHSRRTRQSSSSGS